MKSRSWSRKSVLACGIISLLARGAAGAQAAPAKSPAIVLVDGADAAQWQTWTKDLGWQVIAPAGPEGRPAANANIDVRVQEIGRAHV